MSNSKRIAKNTLFLYFRMILIMGVTLYTSRVVLDKLGVDDFGLYSVVGGVVGMLSFINGTLSIGTLRFLTYELGRNEKKRLNKTFNTALYTHLALALFIALILETGGLWFVVHKLVIPPERLNAAVIAYHISIFTSIILITQVPYTSLIMAHERMGVYAYVSIFEAVAKLLVVYLLTISSFDKLIVYAMLLAIVQIITALFYRLYCVNHFSESRLGIVFDKSIFKSMMRFSGWNILANLSETLRAQGFLVLLNMFFQPAVVAAQTISNQVAGAMMQFISNFRTAINPQIIKYYAVRDYESSKRLTLSTTILVFDLILLLGLPTLFVTRTIMSIWLVEIPAYAVEFTQYIIIYRILGTFDASFYVPMMAASKIKTNSIFSIIFGPGIILLLYLIFQLGGDVMWLQYISIITIITYSFLIKPWILVREIKGYSLRDLIQCYFSCGKVALLSIVLSYCIYLVIGNSTISSSALLFISSALTVCVSSYVFLEKSMRKSITQLVIDKVKRIFIK